MLGQRLQANEQPTDQANSSIESHKRPVEPQAHRHGDVDSEAKTDHVAILDDQHQTDRHIERQVQSFEEAAGAANGRGPPCPGKPEIERHARYEQL